MTKTALAAARAAKAAEKVAARKARLAYQAYHRADREHMAAIDRNCRALDRCLRA